MQTAEAVVIATLAVVGVEALVVAAVIVVAVAVVGAVGSGECSEWLETRAIAGAATRGHPAAHTDLHFKEYVAALRERNSNSTLLSRLQPRAESEECTKAMQRNSLKHQLAHSSTTVIDWLYPMRTPDEAQLSFMVNCRRHSTQLLPFNAQSPLQSTPVFPPQSAATRPQRRE